MKAMTLPSDIMHLLRENAKVAGVPEPRGDDDLFSIGILDSFALVDLIALLEATYSIQIPDSDVKPENFRTINAIQQYLNLRTD